MQRAQILCLLILTFVIGAAMSREISIGITHSEPITTANGSKLTNLKEYRYEVYRGRTFIYEEAHAAERTTPRPGSRVNRVVGPLDADEGDVLSLVVYACAGRPGAEMQSIFSIAERVTASAATCSAPRTQTATVGPADEPDPEEPPIEPPIEPCTNCKIKIICRDCIICRECEIEVIRP